VLQNTVHAFEVFCFCQNNYVHEKKYAFFLEKNRALKPNHLYHKLPYLRCRCESSSDESDSAVAMAMTPAQKRRQQLAAMAEKKQAADRRRRRSRLAFSDSGQEEDDSDGEEKEERPLDDREGRRASFLPGFRIRIRIRMDPH
jgi:hypothetical protein